MRAARLGVPGYVRGTALPRLIGPGPLPTAREALARLIEIDRELMAIREAHAPRPARNGALEADKEGTRTSDATPSGDGAPC